MICRNCGNTLKENEKFCTLCGTYNDPSIPPESEDYSDIMKDMNLDVEKDNGFEEIDDINSLDDQELEETYAPSKDLDVQAFIGEDYKWIAERPFNIYALLLSWIYFLYRKMYIIGTIGLIITGIVIRYIPIIQIPYIILSMVGCGLFFNNLYLKIVERKVERIRENANSTEDVEKLCRKKGGVNVILPLIIFAIFLGIIILSYFNFNTNQKQPNFWEKTVENTANCKLICRNLKNRMEDENNKIELMGCKVKTNTDGLTIYDIYIMSKNNGTEIYRLYENVPKGDLTLKGDTSKIKELEEAEKETKLSETDKEFLQTSIELKDDFNELKNDSEEEDKQINNYQNTKPKTNFYFKIDDLFK